MNSLKIYFRNIGKIFLIGFFLNLTACGFFGQDKDSGKPLVLVSIPPQAYFVDRIAGDRVRVQPMVPAGASPETYEPSMKQLKNLSQAVLFLTIGRKKFPIESELLEPVLKESPNLNMISVSEGIPDDDDPHVWLSPGYAKVIVKNTTDALINLFPEERDVLRANALELFSEIDLLDEEIRTRFLAHKVDLFLVHHPAWGHFAQHYRLTQIPLEEDGKEPSAGALAQKVKAVQENGVVAIYVEPQFSPESAQVMATELGLSVITIDPLAYDWVENMRDVSTKLSRATVK